MGRIASCSSSSSSSQQRLPWLMLASDPAFPGIRSFYSLTTKMARSFPAPESADSVENRCFSSKGWLLVVTRKLSMSLVDPFRCVQLALPEGSNGSLDAFDSFYDRPYPDKIVYVDKFALSSPPSCDGDSLGSNSSYCVAIVYGDCGKVALWRRGDVTWSKVVKVTGDLPPPPGSWIKLDELKGVSDVLYYKGEFYVVRYAGWIYACGFEPDEPDVARARFVADISKSELFPDNVMKIYLVESDGKLLVVIRVPKKNEKPFAETSMFRVLQLNERIDGGFKVKDVKDLGGRSLFLGDNESFSADASSTNLKANCIYFTDDWYEIWPKNRGAGSDMGIYNLEDGMIESYYEVRNSSNNLVSPIWI